MYSEIINGKEYRLVKFKDREKLVSKDGDLINPYRRNWKCKYRLDRDGYLTDGHEKVHLYVAYAWVDGWFKGAEVNHKDFDRTNPHADNLEWVSHQENIQYSVKYNHKCICESKQGINNGRHKYSEEQVYFIREQYDKGMTVSDIVRELHGNNLSYAEIKNIHSTVSAIAKRKSWKNLPKK